MDDLPWVMPCIAPHNNATVLIMHLIHLACRCLPRVEEDRGFQTTSVSLPIAECLFSQHKSEHLTKDC